MTTIELAEMLYMQGYLSVLCNQGVDLEKLLLGYSTKPINEFELHKVAKREGFILTSDGVWVKALSTEVI